jgi:uncharacterized MnhB-related membrane protein
MGFVASKYNVIVGLFFCILISVELLENSELLKSVIIKKLTSLYIFLC